LGVGAAGGRAPAVEGVAEGEVPGAGGAAGGVEEGGEGEEEEGVEVG